MRPGQNGRLLRRTGLGTASPLVTAIAAAITRQENTPSSLNNPGALMNVQAGQLQQYATLADGQAALDNQIQLNINRGLTLPEFFAGVPGGYPGYANAASGNNPVTYANNVSAWTGIPQDVPLNQLQTTYTGSSEALNTLATSSLESPGDTLDTTTAAIESDTSDDTTGTGLDASTLILAAAGLLAVVILGRMG